MTAEVSARRKAIAVVVLAVALFVAVVVQLTVVNRLPLPGAATPDLVLLLVAAIAVNATPAMAAITGFAGGLALDVAPPAAHYAGEYALVFCLVCYAAARVYRAIIKTTGEHDVVTAFTIMVGAVAAGEAGKAAFGMLLSEPDVTRAAVSRVLPGAVLYDLVLSPFAFWLVTWLMRGTVFSNGRQKHAPALEFSRQQRLASVFRQASVGAAPNLRLAGTGAAYGTQSALRRLPNLRLAGTGKNYASRPAGRVPKLRLVGTGNHQASRPVVGRVPKLRFGTGNHQVSRPAVGRVPKLRLAGTGKNYASQAPAGRVPKLRLSDARASSIRRTTAAFSGSSQFPLAANRTRKLNFAGDLPVRSTRVVRTPGKNWLRATSSPALSTAGLRPARGPARGWLGSAGADGLAGRWSGTGAGRRTSRLADVRIGRRMGDVINGRASARRTVGLAGGRKRARPRTFTRGTLSTARSGAAIAPQVPRTAAEALAARSAPSGLSALSGAGTPLAGGRSPQPGWLSGGRSASTPTVARTPRSGWLGSSRSRPRTVIGSTVAGRTVIGAGPGIRKGAFRRHRRVFGGNWYTASPSGAWLRRGRHPWRKRSQRLLRMMGVGK